MKQTRAGRASTVRIAFPVINFILHVSFAVVCDVCVYYCQIVCVHYSQVAFTTQLSRIPLSPLFRSWQVCFHDVTTDCIKSSVYTTLKYHLLLSCPEYHSHLCVGVCFHDVLTDCSNASVYTTLKYHLQLSCPEYHSHHCLGVGRSVFMM